MQNNMAEASQHIENGLSMAAIKNIASCDCHRHDVNGNTITRLVNYNDLLYTVIQIIIALPELKSL